MIGAGLLNLFAPLLAEIGAMILFWVLILIGVAALAGVKPAQVFAAGHWLAAKLSEAVAGLRNQFDQGRDLRTAKHTAKKEATEAASKPAHMNAATEPAPQSSTEPAKDLPKPVAERQQEIKINVPHSEAAQTELLADEKAKRQTPSSRWTPAQALATITYCRR